MCFNYSLYRTKEELEERYNAKLISGIDIKPFYYTNAFTLPLLPVVVNENEKSIENLFWGLIPDWIKDKDSAESIRTKTFNARSETIFEKPSFRKSIMSKICLIPMDGFFEWMNYNNNKYPFYISCENNDIFSVAGLWDIWKDPMTGNMTKTFSLITTNANDLLSKIHNTKLRMPAVIKKSDEKKWLNQNLEKEEILNLLKPVENDFFKAHTISKIISQKNTDKNTPNIRNSFNYNELTGF